MNKIIDHNGRLFGRVSIIDLIVILVVAVMALAIAFKNSAPVTSTTVTDTPITYQIQLFRVYPFLADNIHEGDDLYDKDHATGGSLGKVVSVEVLPATSTVELPNGTVAQVGSEDRCNILLTVEGSGTVTDGRYSLNRVYELGVNASRNFYTKYASFTGSVMNIQ